MTLKQLTAEPLTDALARGVTPGGVLQYGSGDILHDPIAFGKLSDDGRDVSVGTRYDLASLTKVVATLPSVLQLITADELALDRPIRHWFSNSGWFQKPSLADTTVRQLLAHNSGLPNWIPLFTHTRDRLLALGMVQQSPVNAPGGTALYSDLGFMLLGALVERVSGQRLDDYAREQVFRPLGMDDTDFRPILPDGSPQPTGNLVFAPTENCGWRNRLLVGEVHDENCYAWHGVAGHAGLFGTAADLGRYAQAWLRLDSRLGSAELLAEAIKLQARTETGEPRGLGWLLSHADGFAGPIPGYGHTGFTGTSLWLDPDADRFTVLLTNRVHPDRHRNPPITDLRRSVHMLLHERDPL